MKYDNGTFKIILQKYPNKAFLVPIINYFVLHKFLYLVKLEDAEFKYDNSFFIF